MNFEPADPPLLDPYILERFTEEEIRKSEQNMRHQYVLRKLQDFLPKHNRDRNNVTNNNVNKGVNNVLNVRLGEKNVNILPNRLNLSITNVFSSNNKQKHFSPSVVVKCSRPAKPLILPSSVPLILPKPPVFTPNVSLEGLTPNVTLQSVTPLSHCHTSVTPLSRPQPRTPSPLLPASPSPPPPVIKPRATKRFSYSQSCILEEFFQKYGSARIVDRVALAQKLGLYKNDVIGWFQSRRRKERRALVAKGEHLVARADQDKGLLHQQIFTSESVR